MWRGTPPLLVHVGEGLMEEGEVARPSPVHIMLISFPTLLLRGRMQPSLPKAGTICPAALRPEGFLPARRRPEIGGDEGATSNPPRSLFRVFFRFGPAPFFALISGLFSFRFAFCFPHPQCCYLPPAPRLVPLCKIHAALSWYVRLTRGNLCVAVFDESAT